MRILIALAFALLAFAPVAATAESQDEQMACMIDAFNVCGHAIPDRERVAACLAQNIRKLSPACRTVMLRYNKPSGSRARVTAARN